jgi:hypothetical protein
VLPSFNFLVPLLLEGKINSYSLSSSLTPSVFSSARTILESEPITIAGNIPAHKSVYTEKISGALSKIMEIYIVKGKMGYIFTYLANTDSHDKYLPLVQRMVDSLNVTTSSNR